MISPVIVEAVLQKKKSAFTIFYNEIVDHFFGYLKNSYNLSNEEINDIVAETFIKIWNNLDKFNQDKGNFENWVWTILRNTTKDYFKKKSELSFSQLDNENLMSDDKDLHFEDKLEDNFDIVEELETKYQYNQIHQAMEQLKGIDREILFLRFGEEKSLEEISQILGLSYSNVRVRLHRAIAKLKDLLKKT